MFRQQLRSYNKDAENREEMAEKQQKKQIQGINSFQKFAFLTASFTTSNLNFSEDK